MENEPSVPLRYADVRGLRLAYADFGGTGRPLLALHGHFGRARMFAPLAAALGSGHRVIALEQRAHGRSGRDGDVHPDAYLEDAATFLRDLGAGPAVVLGHSAGGVTAFRLAARHPELVAALIVEDHGALNRQPDVANPVLDISGWPRRTGSLAGLRRAVEAHGIPDAGYFLESATEYEDGWGFLFDHDQLMESQRLLMGDWWPDWLASTCPALLIHGTESFVLPTAMAHAMAERRPRTTLREFPGRGHWVHDEDPEGFARAVADFLATL
ncbi:alpha/beta fold hydrolase [Streptomyces marincola]|uniref:alpha/beta fold hydrolase n=1 Tax=Streptomyces marincola TaxID=2878388 RepID=UPI001CF1664A|nr:alpha/beta hydrolase [Streptomyces marincola]UCM86860.1 alpha/beta hydrolase [Streptomyces marincola]